MSLKIDKQIFEDVLKRRNIIMPSFGIYGGSSGLQDLGPVATSVQNNVVDIWRKHFLIQDNIVEINCTALTPQAVLKASGHVDKFSDTIVKDVDNAISYRTDKLIEDFLEKNKDKLIKDKFTSDEINLDLIKAGSMSIPELQATIDKYNILTPDNKKLGEINDFNLMFQTKIGPDSNSTAFMRPETAQGIFVNFRNMRNFFNDKLPFGVAQVGNGYRNEIAPRNNLLRVREFPMGEIEWFVDPEDKGQRKFKFLKDTEVPLWSRDMQLGNTTQEMMNIGAAVEGGMISNTTLAQFMVKTLSFLKKIGIQKDNIRFRQHLATEMAHQACDCWDAEIQTSQGWVECVGHADRACFDLEQHMKCSGTDFQMARKLDTPIIENRVIEKFEKGVMGKTLKKDSQIVMKHITDMTNDEKLALGAKLKTDGTCSLTIEDKTQEVLSTYVSFEEKEVKVHEIKFTPHVIEPSFGLGRIVYAVLENTFFVRPDQEVVKGEPLRTQFNFPFELSPIKVGILPLQTDEKFTALLEKIEFMLKEEGISCKIEASGVAIGRRQSRLDEIGVSFGVTVDQDSLNDNKVTIREVNTCKQIRVDIEGLQFLIKSLLSRSDSFDNLINKQGEASKVKETEN